MKKIYVVTEISKHLGEMPLIAYPTKESTLAAIKKLQTECKEDGISSTFDYWELELAE